MVENEEQGKEGKGKAESEGQSGEGHESAADEKVKQLNTDTERINQAIAENENAKARQKLSGVVDAGKKEEEKEETDRDYALSVVAGKHNVKA